MRKWLTAFILVAAMLGGVVGVGAHENEGTCALSRLPDCCKKAQSASKTREASMARLCCNLNCSEPGSGGSSGSSFSPQPSVAPTNSAMPAATTFNNAAPLGRHSQSPYRRDSNPKYIQHLALLI